MAANNVNDHIHTVKTTAAALIRDDAQVGHLDKQGLIAMFRAAPATPPSPATPVSSSSTI